MNRSKPIGCNALHFPAQVGKEWVCMYCNEVVDKPNEGLSITKIKKDEYNQNSVHSSPTHLRSS